MSYSRRQLEAFGEPFGSCATRVKPGGYGRIYGVGNEPEPEGSRPSGEDYYYQTGTMGSGPYGGQPAGFMVANPEYKGAEYVPYTGAGVPSEDSDYYYRSGSMSGPGQYMVANPAYKADVPAYVPFTSTTTAATSTGGGGGTTTTTGGGGGTTTTTGGGGATTNTGGGGGTATTTGGGGGSNWINAGGATLFEGNTDAIRNYIKNLYTTELKRDADTEGLNWWTRQIAADGKVSQDELNAWRAGATRAGETLVNVSQQEAARRAAEEAARRAAEEAARRAAEEAARRAAEEAARAGQGTNVNRPGGFLGAPFIGGREYNPFYAGPDARSDLVNMAYQRLLNRQPDPEGLAYYSQEMTRGLTGQGLVSKLTSSPEFQRSQDFQRAYTSTFRPGYQEFGPSGQYNQPIYLSNYTNYARSPEFAQPLYNTTMMTPQQLGYGFGSFNPFAYGGTNEFASADTAPASSSAAGGSTAAARGGRIKDDEGIAALLPR